MTLREAYAYGQEQLKNANISDATLDAWYLLEFVTGITRTTYYLDTDKEMTPSEEQTYRTLLEKRASHIPLQHLTGVQEFMGFDFCVNEHVLIPRQDTEILVESVLDNLKPGMDVLDMCTGSGCIILSLMKLERDIRGMGVDISGNALNIARQNAQKLGVDAQFLQSNLFDGVEGVFDVIVSNPPYIRTDVIRQLQEEVKFHDPMLALDGKEDGLYFYRRIVEESVKHLKKNGKLYFEIGHDQAEDVVRLMKNAGFAEVTVKKDLAGLDRVVFGVYI